MPAHALHCFDSEIFSLAGWRHAVIILSAVSVPRGTRTRCRCNMYDHRLRFFRFLALSLCVGATFPSHAAELLNSPVYNPTTKSYFEMVDGSHGLVKGTGVDFEGPTWGEAVKLSSQRSYKDKKGRLAIVRDLATHEFLLTTFRPGTYVWIGLRYWCSRRALEWSDGEPWKAGSFQAWDQKWKQDDSACSTGLPTEYMPVAYSPPPTFDWIGKGSGKRYYYFFVEYPTGGP